MYPLSTSFIKLGIKVLLDLYILDIIQLGMLLKTYLTFKFTGY